MAGRAWRMLAIAAGLWACLASSVGRAANGERFRLSWVRGEGAETCPGEAALASDIVARLGRDPFGEDPTRTLHAHVWKDGRAWHVRIQVRDVDGEDVGRRELQSEGEDCGGVFSATGLALALTIDPNAKLAAVEPPPAIAAGPVPPARQSTEPPPPEPPAPPPPQPEEEPRHDEREVVAASEPRDDARSLGALSPRTNGAVMMSLRGAGALELLPAPSPGLEVSLAWHDASRFGVAVGMAYFHAVQASAAPGDYRFGLTDLALDALYDVVRSDPWSIVLHLGARGGAMRAIVLDPTPTDPGDHAFIALTAGVQFLLRIHGPFLAELGATGVAPLVRRRFLAEGVPAPAFAQPAVGAIVYGGLGASL